jgi:HK97 family phage prohead protease
VKTSRTFMDMRLWKKRVAEGKPPENALLRKSTGGTLAKQADDGHFTFVFSDGSVDRHGDTVDAKGWDISNYQKGGGPLLWAHDYQTPPVGKVNSLFLGDLRLSGEVEFTPRGMSEFNDMIRDMVSGGFLSATSVGFSPKDYEYNEERGGFDFKAQELLEISIVPVPANPNALIEARSAGIDLSEMEKWVTKGLYWIEDEGSLLVPRESLELAADALGIQMSSWNAPSEVLMAEIQKDVTDEVPEEEIFEGPIQLSGPSEFELVLERLEVVEEMLKIIKSSDEEDDSFEVEETAPEVVADISEDDLKELVGQSIREAFSPFVQDLTRRTGKIPESN